MPTFSNMGLRVKWIVENIFSKEEYKDKDFAYVPDEKVKGNDEWKPLQIDYIKKVVHEVKGDYKEHEVHGSVASTLCWKDKPKPVAPLPKREHAKPVVHHHTTHHKTEEKTHHKHSK